MMNSQKAIKYRFLSEPQAVIPAKAGIQSFLGVHGFKGSGVQGSILIPGLHLGCVFTIKGSVSSGLIQHLKLNWQLLGKMNICNEDFESSMPSLSLTLNVEP
jgi:hypothetical protein